MSNIALMFLKPEFTLVDRKTYFPLIQKYLATFSLTIQHERKVETCNEKEFVFNQVYANLLENARQPLSEEGYVGGYAYLRLHATITDEQLFQEWVSPNNPALSKGENKYYLEKDNLHVVNPFCPYQRRLFTKSQNFVHLFLISKNSSLSWSEIKPLFQGTPVQSGGQNQGVRSYLSRCSWYTPTTNGLHISASDHDAKRETREMMHFFKNQK